MSGIQYQLYRESVMRLADSILIKDEAMAQTINLTNQGRLAQLGLSVSEDPTTWKYYLNLAGEYHVLDTPMQIVSLDTMETINFNRESLLIHRATLRAYTYDSRYYAELVNRFPNQEFLIRGILNPVNKARAIAAADYTILRYSNAEVEINETDLIEKLQRFITTLMARWYNDDFRITDELYGVAFMGSVVANLPSAIMMIRNENINTYRAHSFHIWNYLESHGRLGRFRNYFTTKQKLWLYRNLKWVFANAGKEYTFEKLMDIILTHRGIPVAFYEHIVNSDKIADEIYANPLMQRTPLNLLEQIAPDPTFKTVRYVMEKQIPLARDNLRFYEDNYQALMYKLSRSRLTKMITKTYESEVIDTSEQLSRTFVEFLLNHWLFFATHNRYPAVITATNPYSSESMRMTVREAFVLWLYAINKTTNHTLVTVPTLEAIYVKRLPAPTVTELKGVVESRLVDTRLIEQLVAEQIPVGVMTSTEAFYDTVWEIHQTYLRHRKAFEYSQHLDARGQIQAITDRFFTHLKCDLSTTPNETYVTYLNNRGWDFENFSRADYELLANELFEKATGSDVRISLSLRDIQEAMLGVMSQLGTYATHYIQTIDASPATMLGTVPVRVGDNDMEEKAYLKVDRVSTHVLRVRARHLKRLGIDLGRKYLDLHLRHPISKERICVDPTLRIMAYNTATERVRILNTTIQVETDLQMDLGHTEWARIPDLNLSQETYRKTISPSVVLDITPQQLSTLNPNRLSLHSNNPGTNGTAAELKSLQYARRSLSFKARVGNRRFLNQSVQFQLTSGDVVTWVSYWRNNTFLFSVPVMSMFYPIDGVLIVDAQTTYLESNNG